MNSTRTWTSIVLLALAMGGGSAGARQSRVLRAGEDASTLAATVALAKEGDVVEVPEGTWKGPIELDTRITLRGTGGVLDGGGEGTVVRIAAAGATVEDLQIRSSGAVLRSPDCCVYVEPKAKGATIRNNRLSDCGFGIWIHETEGVRIAGNRVRGRTDTRVPDRGNGIQLFDGTDLVVRDNVVTHARDGIYVSATEESLIENNRTDHQRYGVHYMYSYSNTLRGNVSRHNTGGFALMESKDLIVEGNVAEDNERYGLLFRDAQNCRIEKNRLLRNGQGMFFFSSTDNEIRHNRVAHNEIGAKVWAGSHRNEVRGNEFIANKQQIFYVGSDDLVWGEHGPGNFWSDYTGWDQDGDGYGDRPYRVDSFTANLTYKYPGAALLMRSPALELLSHLQSQLPMLKVPTVVDRAPRMGEVSP
jgi:nitrous oxidase accessory protein